MKREPEAPRLHDEPTEPDEIEIIEVVGMDDDVPAPAAEVDEVVVSFDEEPRTGVPAAAPRAADAEERLARLRADFENLKRRVEREREEYFRHATASLVSRLLPVLDNFERALASARHTPNGETLVEGVTLIHRQLLEELRREGLRIVECLGHSFDPSVHEAVATDGASRLPVNTVVEELQRGYYFEDRLLRPALVRVSVSAEPGREPLSDREET